MHLDDIEQGIEAEMGVFTKKNLADIVENTSFAEHDSEQSGFPLNYTINLVESRRGLFKDLKKTLVQHLKSTLEGKKTLEIGPGADDILFEIFREYDIEQWHALDINPNVVERIANLFEYEKRYFPVLGNIRRLSYQDNFFDIVCGLCALDSVVDFNSVTAEVHRVLKPGGVLIHVQDLPPSPMTLIHLAHNDKKMTDDGEVWLYEMFFSGDGGVTHIKFPKNPPVQTHKYLHQGLAREFHNHGFVLEEIGARKYSQTFFETFVDSSWIFANSGYMQPPCSLSPEYSYMIMRKT